MSQNLIIGLIVYFAIALVIGWYAIVTAEKID